MSLCLWNIPLIINLNAHVYVTMTNNFARSVLLVAKALGFKLKIEEVDLLSGSYKQSPFKKIHPDKTIPCLKDGKHYIWESHAISEYLVNQYRPESDLIPLNNLQKAHVDRLVHFDSEYLTPLTCDMLVPVIFRRKIDVSNYLGRSVDGVYAILNKQLQHSQWLVGNSITVADLCYISSISTLNLLRPVKKNSRLFKYMEQFEELHYYREGNKNGLNIVADYVLNNVISSRYHPEVFLGKVM